MDLSRFRDEKRVGCVVCRVGTRFPWAWVVSGEVTRETQSSALSPCCRQLNGLITYVACRPRIPTTWFGLNLFGKQANVIVNCN
jgi:hypothetical protein